MTAESDFPFGGKWLAQFHPGWHASGNRQGTRRKRRTLTGQGLDACPPCRCRESEAFAPCRLPACRTPQAPGTGTVVVTNPQGRVWFDSRRATTGSSVWKSNLLIRDLSRVRIPSIDPAARPVVERPPNAGHGPTACTPSAGGGLRQHPVQPAPAASHTPAHCTARGRAPWLPAAGCNGTL